MTLPAEPQADREFASLLRAADETMTAVTIGPESPLVGTSVRDLEAVVAAVRPASASIEAIPERDRLFEPGDTVFLLGRPDALRRVEAEAAGDAETDDVESGDSEADDAGTDVPRRED
ncbi:TrkA C-terminal domain-containing protein [Halopenitus salinus]|uniref:TrkA C-terminal domain-containing protein n=1 Tax=Halopenitus salinus TaxID=1198295 RepID=UPI00360FE7A1